MSRLVLEMEDVHLRRGDAAILTGIDWRVATGQHWAVLGPNGSGKTSLLLVAMGYVPSSRGRVFLLEGHISRIVLPEVRRRVGFVSAALADVMLMRHGRTTGLDIVLSGRHASLGLYESGPRATARAALKMLGRLGVERLADVPFQTMSTGERQVCLVARCYMADSELLILDEPCAGLDIAARETVLAAVAGACRSASSRPHILVTHHPEEIVPGITHVLLLAGGRPIALGRRREVLTEANLSAAYGVPLRVASQDGRVWVRPHPGAL